jgi:hypothetical protein
MTLYTDSFPPNNIIMLAPGKRTRGGFMHRCGSGFLLTLAVTFVIALTGCLGKSSPNPNGGAVKTVTLSPSSNFSIDVGGTQIFSANATDSNGQPVLGVSIQFIVASGNPNASAPLSVASNGSACAGTWDPSATLCSAGTPGIAIVSAVVEGVSSQQTTVYVHQHIDSIQITQAEPQPPPNDCFSEEQTWQFQGIAFSDNVDITNTVGPLSWSSSNAGVVTTIPFVPPDQPNVLNQAKTTAKSPGISNLFASVSGTTSSPFPFTSCLIQAIHLQIGGQSQAGNSITVNNGGSVSITATALDTLGVTVPNPPLTWSTTNPEVAAFTSTTNTSGVNSATARANLGGATVFASCTPPSCNIGVLPSLPIYSSDCLPTNVPSCTLPNGTKGYGTISIDVTSTSKPPTYTAWAATTDCQNAPGCSSAMFSVTPGTTPIGAIVGVPRTPNSMMFNHLSAGRVYLGSDQGLMYVDVTASSPSVVQVSNSATPCSVSICGKVLTISNDGKLVAVADTVSTPSQVYIYDAGSNTAIDLIIPGETASAAAFSPDQLKLFLLTGTGKMYVYSTVDALTSVPIATTATDVKFSADGSFAYVAGALAPGNSISAFATCDDRPTVANSQITPDSNFVTTPPPGIPLQIFPSPDAQHVLALDPPNIDIFTTSVTQHALPDGQFVCNPQPQPPPLTDIDPSVNFPPTAEAFNLGQGTFAPIYAQLVADGAEMIIVARHLPAVLLFDVSSGLTSSVQLLRQGFADTDPLSASASTDGSQVYIAACDQYAADGVTCAAGSVHIVCTTSCTTGQGDFQQVPYVNINDNNNPNMCNGQGTNAPLCLPNLIAIKPQ